jgi:cell division protein FtsQ
LLEKKKQIRKNRFKKDHRKTRQRILGRLAVGFKLFAFVAVMMGFSALFMVGYAAVTHTDYFRADAIKVKGLSRLAKDAVLAQAQIQKGDNLLALNLSLVRKRLLAHPWIAAACVAREIPGTIRIEITEHQALAVLDLGRKFLIDTHGRIFKEYNPDDPRDLPLVTGMAYWDISLGDDALSPVMAAVVEVLRISRTRKSTIAYAQIRQVHVDPELGVSLRAWDDQRLIKLGFSNFENKYRSIGKLLPYLEHSTQWRRFESIDANNPDRIVVQLGTSLEKDS